MSRTVSVYSKTYNLDNGSVCLIESSRTAHAKTPGQIIGVDKIYPPAKIVGNLILTGGEITKEFRVIKGTGSPTNCCLGYSTKKCGTKRIRYPAGSTHSKASYESDKVPFEKNPADGGWDLHIRESCNLNCGNLTDGGDVALSAQLGRIVSFDMTIDEQAVNPEAYFLDNRHSVNSQIETYLEDVGLLQAIKGVVGKIGFKVFYTPIPKVDPNAFVGSSAAEKTVDPTDFTEAFEAAYQERFGTVDTEGVSIPVDMREVLAFGMV